MFSSDLSFLAMQNIGVLFIFSKKKQKKKEELDAQEAFKNSLLCRFVLDGAGKKVGESVAVDEDVLIIKSRSTYLGVPLKHVEEDGKTLLVMGLVEKDKAEMLGEKWRKESFCEINHEKGE